MTKAGHINTIASFFPDLLTIKMQLFLQPKSYHPAGIRTIVKYYC